MIKSFLKNATVKNAGWLVFGKIAQMLTSFVVGILTTRYLGPNNFGLINYSMAYVAFFMSFCTLGINSVLVKEFIDNPEEEGKIIGSTLLMRVISSFLSVGIIICIVSIVDAGDPTLIIVTLLCSISLIFNIFETFNYWFQSKLRSKVTAIATLIAYVATSIYKIVLLAFGKSVEWFAFATALDYIVLGILLLFCYKKSGGERLSFSKEVSKRILEKSAYFILPGVMVAVYGYVDKIMLKHMLGESDVGYYATATALCTMWCFVLSAIIDSVYPSIMKAHKSDVELFEKRNKQLYAIVFYVSIAVSFLFCVFGDLIIFILYGNAYSASAPILKVITWYTAFSYLGVARNAWIVCENGQKYLKYIYISAALVNVILNFLFIPLWGAVGAAVASLITQITTVFVVPFFIKNIRRNSILMIEAICFKGIR